MDDPIDDGLIILHKRIKFLWFAVLTGMVTIIFISWLVYNFQLIELKPVVNQQNADKVTLVVIVIIVLLMFFLKRSYLMASKIKQKAQKNIDRLNRAEFAFLALDREDHALFAASASYLNKIYLMIWALAELIILVAFINFVLAPALNTFFIYSIVALYALISNYPSIQVYRKLYNYIIP